MDEHEERKNKKRHAQCNNDETYTHTQTTNTHRFYNIFIFCCLVFRPYNLQVLCFFFSLIGLFVYIEITLMKKKNLCVLLNFGKFKQNKN